MSLSSVKQPHMWAKWRRSGAVETPEYTRRRRTRAWEAHIARNNEDCKEFLTNLDISKYCCDSCGATGIKLWRETGFFSVKQYCAVCAGHPDDVDEQGDSPSYYTTKEGTQQHMGDSDQLYPSKYGNLLPSVPCYGGWWGYSSVPDFGCKWWKNLPTYKVETTSQDGESNGG